jgi:beta-glucosidase
MRLELNLDFERRFAPDEFFFGVAYAPYCEGGGLNTPDGPKNTDWCGRTLGQDADSRPREGIRFWTDYRKHVELAASLGLNAFRMGIEWARCQPSVVTEPTEPPAWDGTT